ncbi:MAG: M48 family metallopeptidase [Pseudomonadota bacterium]|nr:M48 family metallopeptidase [Gammaproteobacteria bacterium]MBU1558864.1 M48 family metallopeptidase [Gammaproteobacteria bacterium]MBU1927256.1 M48 family metallopeptidase [Gammaproteobacteria bacterium]MBU2545954.1 M48 family metallopeptidase [Gammaproteobacteria bacterium]
MATSKKLPQSLELLSIHEKWSIHYDHVNQDCLWLTYLKPSQLLLQGNVRQAAVCVELLQKWLRMKARNHLGRWLQALSEDTDLKFKGLSIRGQRTRWGSCSTQQRINLNYKLLFLPATLVEHVLLHELCHTREFNHSSRFWALLSEWDTDCQKNKQSLNEADQYLPKWL